MMKYVKSILTFLLIFVVMLGFLPAQAQEEFVTLDRIVQVNDTQIVLEFSEPVRINTKAPHVDIRVVNQNINWPIRTKDGHYLQWLGNMSYADDKHDRIVWTLREGGLFGLTKIDDILNWNGEMEQFHVGANRVIFDLEDLAFNVDTSMRNGRIDNIVSADGKRYLHPMIPAQPEACHFNITKDYSYRIDASKFESLYNQPQYEGSILFDGSEIEREPIPEDVTVDMVKNDPIIVAAILGGATVFGVLLVVVALVIRKKKGVKS